MKQRLIAVTCLALFAWAPGARAQSTADTLRALDQCGSLADEHQRLACFDRVTREVRANQSPPSAAPTAPGQRPTQQARAHSDRQNFGFSAEELRQKYPKEQPAQLKSIRVRVAASKRYEPGYWAVMLEDGAIWEVTEMLTNYRGPGRGDTVEIRRGIFGGFMMYADGQAGVHVRRVS